MTTRIPVLLKPHFHKSGGKWQVYWLDRYPWVRTTSSYYSIRMAWTSYQAHLRLS